MIITLYGKCLTRKNHARLGNNIWNNFMDDFRTKRKLITKTK